MITTNRPSRSGAGLVVMVLAALTACSAGPVAADPTTAAPPPSVTAATAASSVTSAAVTTSPVTPSPTPTPKPASRPCTVTITISSGGTQSRTRGNSGGIELSSGDGSGPLLGCSGKALVGIAIRSSALVVTSGGQSVTIRAGQTKRVGPYTVHVLRVSGRTVDVDIT